MDELLCPRKFQYVAQNSIEDMTWANSYENTSPSDGAKKLSIHLEVMSSKSSISSGLSHGYYTEFCESAPCLFSQGCSPCHQICNNQIIEGSLMAPIIRTRHLERDWVIQGHLNPDELKVYPCQRTMYFLVSTGEVPILGSDLPPLLSAIF